MNAAEHAFGEVLERLEQAEERLMLVSAAAWDVDDGLHQDDVVARLQTLLDAIYLCRRALSQAAGWIDATIDYLDREGPHDDPGAGGEREGEGTALQVA